MPVPSLARRLARGSIADVTPVPLANRYRTGWRAALWIGGAVTLATVSLVAAALTLASRSGPLAAALAERSWPLLVPLCLAVSTWSARVGLASRDRMGE